jgi:hypothetical protein
MAYTFNGGELVCYWCLFAEMKATGADLEIQSLDASADGKPRRT